MSFKPDYGLRQMNDGISREVDQFFYDFRLYSLTVLGRGQYSTGVEMPLAGELHALSLDFNQIQLEQILAKAPPQIAAFLRQELARDPINPRTIDFQGEVVFGVRARLGELQKAQRESFVPLVAQEILSGSTRPMVTRRKATTMISLVSPEYNLKTFCNHMRGKDPDPLAVMEAASAEISHARRLHRKTTKDSDSRKGSRGSKYCLDLQKLISLLMNGSVPPGSTPEFLTAVKPLVQQLLQKWKIGNLRLVFSLLTAPDNVSLPTEPIADPVIIIVSKDEITRRDIAPALNVLQSLFRSPEVAKSYKERVDIAIDGYNDDPRELDEIEEVREYVQTLDQQFPFWLFFLSKQMLGLQCIVFCHLLPFLTDEAKAQHHPRQLEELLLKRWLPAMNQVVEFTGISEKELEAMTERFMTYVKVGPLKLPYAED